MNKQQPFFDKTNQDTAFCGKHPYSYVGKDREGNWFRKCWLGKKHNEDCEITVNQSYEKEAETTV